MHTKHVARLLFYSYFDPDYNSNRVALVKIIIRIEYQKVTHRSFDISGSTHKVDTLCVM